MLKIKHQHLDIIPESEPEFMYKDWLSFFLSTRISYWLIDERSKKSEKWKPIFVSLTHFSFFNPLYFLLYHQTMEEILRNMFSFLSNSFLPFSLNNEVTFIRITFQEINLENIGGEYFRSYVKNFNTITELLII